MDNRHKWIARKISEGLSIAISDVDRRLQVYEDHVEHFLTTEDCAFLLWFYQSPQFDCPNSDKDDSESPLPELTLYEGQTVPLTKNGFYFLRTTSKPPSQKSIETEVYSGLLPVGVLESLKDILQNCYDPVIQSRKWGKEDSSDASAFVKSLMELSGTLSDAHESLTVEVELVRPDEEIWKKVRSGTPVKSGSIYDSDVLRSLESTVLSWIKSIDHILNEVKDLSTVPDESGPFTELEFWRRRMSKLNTLTECLKQDHFRIATGVLAPSKPSIIKKWKAVSLKIEEAYDESKDNVQYLSTLSKGLEPMYYGTPIDVQHTLPGLFRSLCVMYNVAKYYGTPERMTTMLRKLSNQIITNCGSYISTKGKFWTQDRTELIQTLKTCMNLCEFYIKQYNSIKEEQQSSPGGKSFDFDEHSIFLRLNLFAKRLKKLCCMLTTVSHFSNLALQTHIDGLEPIVRSFDSIVDDIKRKPYDLLEFSNTQFDRDYMEFNVNIHELEMALQSFIDASFENITSTDHAMNLLQQFQSILNRESFKEALNAKYMVIFQNYRRDVEFVQQIYEENKHFPPLPRNAPLVAGNIMWARQLLSKIEKPMEKFSQIAFLMNNKECKKIIKLYNRIARALVEFEELWIISWTDNIERSKVFMSAPLIVQHPKKSRLLVNFHMDVLQLMHETKYLQQLNISVPESALKVSIQESSFKGYFRKLSYLIKKYNNILASVKPIVKPLLRPHMEDIEEKISPGMYEIRWISLSIDPFIKTMEKGLDQVEQLVSKVNDLLENRIDLNIETISKMSFVDISEDRSFSYDEFLSVQQISIAKNAEIVAIRNLEIQNALEDVIRLILTHPRDNPEIEFDTEKCSLFKKYYCKKVYRAILDTTKRSFDSLKKRLASGRSMALFSLEQPFFNVGIELKIPNVALSPSLEDIQKLLNQTGKSILAASKRVDTWEISGTRMDSFYSMIINDKEIVKVVLLLTGKSKQTLFQWMLSFVFFEGSIESVKQQVLKYISRFDKYTFLWKQNLQEAYQAFMSTNPSLEDFEAELQKYMSIQNEVSQLQDVHILGSLALETQPLKLSLTSEAASWKARFSKNLHEKGEEDLKNLDHYIREMTQKLNRKVEDLEDVRSIVGFLKEIREKESNIDSIISPIEEMYSLLMKYDVHVPKEETDLVSDLSYSWKKLIKTSSEVSDTLSQLQVGFKRDLIQQVKTFSTDVVSFRQDWEENGPMVSGLDPMEAVDRLKKFQQMFKVRKRKWESYSSGEELFGLPVTSYPELETTEKEVQMLDRLYSLYVTVITTIKGYGDFFWVDVVEQIDTMAEQVNGYQAQCKKLPKALREWQAYLDCRKSIDDFLNMLPLFQALAHKSMRERHWNELMSITGHQLDLTEDTFKLQHLLECQILDFQEEVEELTSAAVKEEQIETKLNGIESEWADLTLVFSEYKNRGPVILKAAETAELIEKLEDSQMTLGSMATNRYSAPFRTEVQDWVIKLSTVSEIIEQWMMVQNMWTYMEAVFSGGDIVKQLPQEAKRFQNIDKSYIKMVTTAVETGNVVNACYGNEMMRNVLGHLLEQLELCQKSLSAYLETKRAEFPRFYFVSDPTLLEILSLGSDPPSVVPHFQSGLFDSLTDVTFDKSDKCKMLEMFSQQGECVEFEKPVDAKGNIEIWLQRLVDGMQETVKNVIKRASRNVNEMELETFIFGHPAQVALLGIQFQWTADIQEALTRAKTDKSILNKAMKKTEAILKDMVTITVKSDLTKIQRTNLETCITVHMHQKESTEDLIKKKVKDPTDFEWLKQCRFYWREDKNTVIISICDVDFEYSFEYLGVKERLVITPLTDICYITLSQALGMFLGGAPAGPAGTGKTETTKDLGNTLGKYVVVFNCSDQMDYKGMGKIYKGLAQSGLWGCFDEFNRINLDVLSVCAQQVYCVLSAIRERKKSFVFTDGTTVSLDPRVGFFITMNPGYAGRQELPENLKALFRGVTMMVPNRQIIMKVKLAACGYQENDILSKKFFVLYGLCEQQLSKQPHYDFGLRNILSVLRTAGASKRANPDRSEVYLMMRTLRDMNMSKFVAEDVPLFLSLIDDLFPGLKAERAQFPEVETALRSVITERGLQQHQSWINKCIQLYETFLVRHGIMLVGPSGGGKSTIQECLASALTKLGTKTVIWRMNPKAITAPQMFGKMDATTGDWTDGIFSVLWRRAAKNKNQSTWIVLDGPVDAIWIENLNTVLDDNKVLTLANGDRILMTPAMKAMFEPENLANASPATVSRAGIIYVSETELGWEPIVASWIQTRKDSEKSLLPNLFKSYVQSLLDFVRLNLRPMVYNEQVCQVGTLLKLLDGMLTPHDGLKEDQYERVFLYCLVWSLGGLLEGTDRFDFSTEIQRLAPKKLPYLQEKETVYEYFVDETSLEWTHWSTYIPVWEYPKEQEKPKFAQLVIPTLDSVRFEKLLSLVHSVNGASLLVGGPGTAKTSTINQFLSKFNVEETVSKTITFSSLTTPQIFQTTVEGSVEKRQGRMYGPPGGKSMVIFIDDLSMPAINEWGDQVTNEIVRQLLEQGGMYSLEKPIGDMKHITDTQYLAAMNHPGGGKNDVPNRLKRQFAIFNVPLPSVAAINNIFGALVDGRFSSDDFNEDVVSLAKKLVPMTVELWNKVQGKMLPTPAKFHYLFNMRELSKVFQGVILATRDRFMKTSGDQGRTFGGQVASSEGYLLALWMHECRRVFCDKLVTHSDKEWVDSTILDLCKNNVSSKLLSEVEEPLYFVDFLRDPEIDDETGEVVEAHPSYYESIPGGLTEIKTKVEDFQQRFNEESKVMKLELVLFSDALKHLMRISRLLCMDRGSALLVGVGGSGKQSLTRLAAYIAGAYTFQITITKTYNVTNLFEDIKSLYKIAGFKGQPVCFIFTDAEVKDEGFLEYINQILMTGEVAGLFQKDELDLIVNDIRPVMKSAKPNTPDTWENLYSFFLERVRDNLHVVLCFSPVGDKFSRRARQFPGLINGCTIDWFLPWPEEALTSVSSKFIDEFQMACPEEVKNQLKLMMAHVHVFVTNACQEYFEKFRRHVYVTPKSYLSFIQGYKTLYSKKLAYVEQLAKNINSGLQKMMEAKEDVSKMKVDLGVKNQELAVASKEAETLLKSISENTTIAEKEKAKVAVIVDGVTTKASEIKAVKDDAEQDLAAAKPALDAALAALNSISPKDINSLKALKNPPDVIKRIFDSVLMLRHFPVDKITYHDVKGNMVICGTYSEAVKMMGDLNFLGALMNFPKEQINDETVELLKPYFAAPDFNYEAARKASGNVAGLCNWAEAMCTYHNVATVVEPKIVALREAEAELKVAMKEKNAAEERMAVVQGKLDEMQAQFDAAMAQKQALEDDATATQKKMDSANALLQALAGEETRWTEQSKEFDTQIQKLTGDCAIASAFVSYLGPFNKEFRELLISRDFYGDCSNLNIPVTENIEVSKFLVDDAEVGEWTLQGLPTDELSVQNGIMVTRASRYPILVDPQGQGRIWIMNKEEENQLKVTQLNDKMFRNHLEDCLTFGKPLLIENIEEDLDPMLDPVLERRVAKKGKGYVLTLADKEVDFCDTFKLFCTTRLPNPHYSPELSAKVTVVDFTVTTAGLEDQLLGKLILKEKHELEEQRQHLVEEVQTYKKKIKQLEEDLLFRLSNSQGNLLDDTELIDVLAITKQTAQDVTEKLNNAHETNKKINDACEEYRPVAHRATLVYFLIAEFSVVNCMYQTSLAQFNELYELAIDTAEKASMPSKRISNIIDHMTYQIYLYIQRGLFERHKITFALMLANKILVSAGVIKSKDVDIFLKGGGALDINSVRKKPKEWIPDSVWLSVVALSGMESFRDIADSVFRNDSLWRQWYDQEAPELAKVPDYEDRLTKFEKMCVVKSFREDRTLIAASDYIAESLGQKFVESVPLNMEKTWSESHSRCPLICLLSPGADPTKLIEDLAKRKKIKTLGVSMGQGQEIIARKYIATANSEGQWVLLQNTHLGLSYLTEVEQFLSKSEELHEDFRLWVTAEPHPNFPIGLLQMGIKITNEAPVGMKAGLRSSYQWVNQDMLDVVNRAEWRQLLFVMCFLHSVVQERRKFGPIGWNIPYEFNQSDLSACTQFLQNHLMEMDAKKAQQPTWDTIRYMISAIQYGGRITDDFDQLLMDTYAEKYFHLDVLKENAELYIDDRTGFKYTVPFGTEIEVFRNEIELLPGQESPEIFGMHPNADLTFRSLQVQGAISTILDTMPKGAGGSGGMSREEIVDKICEDLLSKIPSVMDKEDTKEKLKKLPGGSSQPLTVHLRQEIDRLNVITHLTTITLKNLRLAIAGTVALSGNLIDALDALYMARIPAEWLKKSWEASTLGNWFTGLLQRYDQLSKWLNNGRPRAYWLTGFFNPQGFLTAMKQEVNRKHSGDKWALDDVIMMSEVTHPAKEFETLKDSPSEGVYIYGLYLDGCAWSRKENKLVDSEPKKLYNPLPVLYVTGVQAKDKKKNNIYEAPTYRVKRRTGLNFITQFGLRTEDDKSKWILRGAALLCTID